MIRRLAPRALALVSTCLLLGAAGAAPALASSGAHHAVARTTSCWYACGGPVNQPDPGHHHGSIALRGDFNPGNCWGCEPHRNPAVTLGADTTSCLYACGGWTYPNPHHHGSIALRGDFNPGNCWYCEPHHAAVKVNGDWNTGPIYPNHPIHT